MMREKILKVLNAWLASTYPRNVIADAIIAAIGEGRVPAAKYNEKRIGWELERTAMGDGFYGNALRVAKDMDGVTDDDRSALDRWAAGEQQGTDHIRLQEIALKIYTPPQPAPDVAAMQACIAELERQTGDAARQHNTDVSALEAKLFQRTREKAELECVQGRLVEALESWNEVENYSAQYWSTPGAEQEITDAWATAAEKRRAALAEVRKPEGGDRG